MKCAGKKKDQRKKYKIKNKTSIRFYVDLLRNKSCYCEFSVQLCYISSASGCFLSNF